VTLAVRDKLQAAASPEIPDPITAMRGDLTRSIQGLVIAFWLWEVYARKGLVDQAIFL